MRAAIAFAAVLLSQLALGLAIWLLRTCPAERPYASPWPLPAAAWPAATAAVVVLAATALLSAARDASRRRHLLEAAAVPGMLIAWLAMRPATSGPVLADAPAGLLIAAVAFALRHRDRGARAPGRRPRLRDLAGGRGWLAANLVLIGVPVVAGLVTGAVVRGPALLLSLVLYPLYAWLQLTLCLVVPFPRLAALAGGRGAVAGCAVGFAMVHWPNAPLMAATFAAMLLWAAAYRAGRPLPALALSMGLAATACTQLLPQSVTAHMRVGPGYVRARAAAAIAAAGPRQDREFVASLYPTMTGRPATATELDRWLPALEAGRRAAVVLSFYTGAEYRARAAGAPPPPLAEQTLWPDIPPAWLERIARTTAAAQTAPGGATWPGFLAGVYRLILGREASAGEIAAWPATLQPRQRQRLVEVLLERRRDLARAPFDTLTVVELAFLNQ